MAHLQRVPGYRAGIQYRENYMREDLPASPGLTKWLGPALGQFLPGHFLAHGYENGQKYVHRYEDEKGKPCDMDSRFLGSFWTSFGLNARPNVVEVFSNQG
ncbi:hypothetical protein BDW02DRAFT_594700 [Decorospora gaudefroyi]|uniref:Uncharacterized protein n=1 Tax=Decorospora gaudefroyi TaxID=184978 RepID=A0A6A5KSK9_9PLEO|nr:hypothetical protein BDW02DRAFT_594700 [Decorospora gaudefroyi]